MWVVVHHPMLEYFFFYWRCGWGWVAAVWRWGCGGCATERASDRPVAKLCLCERQPSVLKQKTAIQKSFNSNSSSNPFRLADGMLVCTKCSSHFNWFMHRLKCMSVDPHLTFAPIIHTVHRSSTLVSHLILFRLDDFPRGVDVDVVY